MQTTTPWPRRAPTAAASRSAGWAITAVRPADVECGDVARLDGGGDGRACDALP